MPEELMKYFNSKLANQAVSIGEKKLDPDALLLSRPVAAFKDEYIDCFKDFVLEVNVLSAGTVSYQGSITEDTGAMGIAIATAAVDGVVAILGVVGMLGAMAAAALAIPLAIAGLAASFAYHKFFEIKKQKQYAHAERVLGRKELAQEVAKIVDLLADLYRIQLESCTIKDAIKLAKSCFKAISSEILKNKEFDFNELLHKASLQGVLMRTASKIPDQSLSMNIRDNMHYSTREMVMMPALYCEESNKFYQCEESRPRKYGFLFFAKQQEVDDYMDIVRKQTNNSLRWQYQHMNATDVALLKSRSLFCVFRDANLMSSNVSLALSDGPVLA